MTRTSTPKSVEEVAAEVMRSYKATKLFQTMAIVSLNMGNRSKHFEEQIGQRGEGEGNVT